jgi:PAS domain S-box-containing protein
MQYQHDAWNLKDGLPSNVIIGILQSPDGYLWIQTLAGLARFDGVRFTVFDRTNTPALHDATSLLITPLLVDRRGAMWLGTTAGLVQYANGAFRRAPIRGGLPMPGVGRLADDGMGTFWMVQGIIPGSRVYVLRDGEVAPASTTPRLPGDVTVVLTRARGGVWVGTRGHGVIRVVDGVATTIVGADALPDPRIIALFESRDGTIWIGTEAGFAWLRDGVLTSHPFGGGRQDGRVTSFAEDEHRLLMPDGAVKHVRVFFRDTGNPGAPEFIGAATDITEWKEAEEKLRQSEAYLAEAQRLSSTGTFGWSVGGDCHFWSEETYRIFDYEQSTPITLQAILDRVHPEDLELVRRLIAETREGREIDHEYRLLMPDGRVKHVHIVAHGVRDRNGRLEIVGALQDVTQQRHSEEALGKLRSDLAHFARVASIGALTASIAHEVNQPLAGVVTNASTCLRMLEGEAPSLEGARRTARRAIRDAVRASEVISRLRALLSRKPPAAGPVDLNEATREVIALSRSELQLGRAVTRLELAEDLPLVTGDRIQLQQVIINLLRNAFEAMNDVEDRQREIVIRTARDGDDRVCLSVHDSGVGFGPDGAERLFDAFYTTKPDGMGIGLSVSRSIIESHGGRLWAVPNEGPGATFAFSIPRGAGDSVDAAR